MCQGVTIGNSFVMSLHPFCTNSDGEQGVRPDAMAQAPSTELHSERRAPLGNGNFFVSVRLNTQSQVSACIFLLLSA